MKTTTALLAICCLLTTCDVNGHGYIKSPRSRNEVASEDGLWYGGPADGPQPEDCVSCLNRKPADGFCGMVSGRNYDAPLDISGNVLPFRPQATYTEGQIIDIDLAYTANHAGHFVFYLCPDGENPSEECFYGNELLFVEDVSVQTYGADANAPKDVNFPNRGYVNPFVFEQRMKFKLPDGVFGEKVLMQWWWMTGNSCRSEGYESYPWPSGWNPSNTGPCPNPPDPTGNTGGEQFWNCVDLTIEPASPLDTPAPIPVPPPVQPVTSYPSVAVDETCDVDLQMSIRLGYYNSESICNPIDVTNIDVTDYTHVVYSYAAVDDSLTMQPTSTDDVAEYAAFITALSGNAVPMISVGGFAQDNNLFSQAAATETSRSTFAASAVTFLQTHGFEGLDISWEYVTSSADYGNFVFLIEALRTALGDEFILTATISLDPEIANNYDYLATSQYVDWLNIKGFETTPSTLLEASSDLVTIQNNIDSLLIDKSIPSEKVVLGLSAFGIAHKLQDANCHEMNGLCSSAGPGDISTCSEREGVIALNEINTIITQEQYDMIAYDKPSSTMFLVHEDLFISFDNSKTYKKKRLLAKEKCLRGVSIQFMDMVSDMSYNPVYDIDDDIELTSTPSHPPVLGETSEPTSLSVSSSSPTKSPVAATSNPTKAPTPTSTCNDSNTMSVRFGYFQSWAQWRHPTCEPINVNNVDPTGYTHLAYSFAKVSASLTIEPWNPSDANEYVDFNALKTSYPDLKTLIAIGGWTHNDPGELQPRFGQAAATAASREAFSTSVVSFLRQYGFDGLDLDWEYPAAPDRGGNPEDTQNYVLMCEELRRQFDEAPEDFLLTMATPVGGYAQYFDFPGLSQYLDWFNVMSYDIHGYWDNPQIVGFQTDMREITTFIDTYYNNVSSDQLVLGLGSYGRSYTLTSSSCNTPGCSFSGGYPGTSCTMSQGYIGLFEINEMIESNQYDLNVFDEDAGAMYLAYNNMWVSYDNDYTFAIKRNYASDSCFRGVMEWAMDMSQSANNPLLDPESPIAAPAPTVPTTPSPIPPVSAPGTCGNGNVGNGICSDTTLCCSEWGWCGTTDAHCSGSTPSPVASPVTPEPTRSPSAGPTSFDIETPIPTKAPITSATAMPTSLISPSPTTRIDQTSSPSKYLRSTSKPSAISSLAPSLRVETATPTMIPVTNAPTKSPTSTPITPAPTEGDGKSVACCSGNNRDCNVSGWCGENESRCGSCGYSWLPKGALSQCIAKWEVCTNDINGCCEGLTCKGSKWWRQCES